MKSYTAYLFDCDGTLIDTTEMIYQCYAYSCQRFGGFIPDRKKVEANIGIPLLPQLELLLGPLSEEKAAAIIKAHMEYQFAIYKRYLRLFPGVAKTLSLLKQRGKKLGVVTSRRRESLDIFLGQTGVLHFFDACITPESTEKHKPSPEPALEAMRLLSAVPSETLLVGDSVFDIACGAGAGVDTAFVNWGSIDSASLGVAPTYIIGNFAQLL